MLQPHLRFIYDDESFKKGLYKLFYAPSNLLLLLFRPTKGFSLLIKCRRDIALNAHAIKGNREAVQRSDIDDLDQLLAGSWPLWTLCILLLHQLPMHKVKPFKSGEMW